MYLPRLNEKILNYRLIKKYSEEQIENLIVSFFLSELSYKDLEKKCLGLAGYGDTANSILRHYGLNKKHRLEFSSIENLIGELTTNNYDKSYNQIIKMVKNVSSLNERKKSNELFLKDLLNDIYGNNLIVDKLVKVRNQFYQNKFRQRLIEEFNSKCAFCQINEADLLIAAHIIPFSDSFNNPDQAFNINNGILLCPIHDKLFENSIYLSLDDDGFLVFERIKNKKVNNYLISISDKRISKAYLNKERMFFLKKHYVKFKKL